MKTSLSQRLHLLAQRLTSKSRHNINGGLYSLSQAHKAVWPLNSREQEDYSSPEACPAAIHNSKKSKKKK